MSGVGQPGLTCKHSDKKYVKRCYTALSLTVESL